MVSYQYRHCHIIKDEPKNLVLEIAESIHRKSNFKKKMISKFGNLEQFKVLGLITIFDHNIEVLYPIC